MTYPDQQPQMTAQGMREAEDMEEAFLEAQEFAAIGEDVGHCSLDTSGTD